MSRMCIHPWEVEKDKSPKLTLQHPEIDKKISRRQRQPGEARATERVIEIPTVETVEDARSTIIGRYRQDYRRLSSFPSLIDRTGPSAIIK